MTTTATCVPRTVSSAHSKGPYSPALSPCSTLLNRTGLTPTLRMQGWARPCGQRTTARAFPVEDTPAARPCTCIGVGRMGSPQGRGRACSKVLLNSSLTPFSLPAATTIAAGTVAWERWGPSLPSMPDPPPRDGRGIGRWREQRKRTRQREKPARHALIIPGRRAG